MSKVIILIDNGHGVSTPGKRSPDGRLLEYRYSREIAEFLAIELEKRGFRSIRLMAEEEDIPLDERCRRANEICRQYGAANALLVSIHCNAAGPGDRWMTARGWEAWTSPGDTAADRLATCLYESASRHLPGMRLRTDYSDGDPDKEARFAILRGTVCPAVLTENLFQDNREDVDFLLSEQGRRAIVQLHADGIVRYLYIRQNVASTPPRMVMPGIGQP